MYNAYASVMLQPKPKTHRRYLLYRLYIPVVYIWFMVWLVTWIAAFADAGPPSALQTTAFGILFPCFAGAVLMILNLGAFPFEYSILGRFERTNFPNERPILVRTGSWGEIGSFRATVPFFGWYVYTSGLGISILGFGRVFIPLEYIDALSERGGSFLTGRRYELVHSSPEVRGPIYIPDNAVCRKLRSVYMKGTRHRRDN